MRSGSWNPGGWMNSGWRFIIGHFPDFYGKEQAVANENNEILLMKAHSSDGIPGRDRTGRVQVENNKRKDSGKTGRERIPQGSSTGGSGGSTWIRSGSRNPSGTIHRGNSKEESVRDRGPGSTVMASWRMPRGPSKGSKKTGKRCNGLAVMPPGYCSLTTRLFLVLYRGNHTSGARQGFVQNIADMT